jgi:hypothetical protein
LVTGIVTTGIWAELRIARAVTWGAVVLPLLPSEPEPDPEPELGRAPAPAVCAGAGAAVAVTSYTLVLATRVSVVTEVVFWRAGQFVTEEGQAVTVTVRVVKIVSVVY